MELLSPYNVKSYFRTLGINASSPLDKIKEAAEGLLSLIEQRDYELKQNPFFSAAGERVSFIFEQESYPWNQIEYLDAEKVKEALKVLSSDKDRFEARLYWHHLVSEKDNEAWDKMQAGLFEEAVCIWRSVCMTNSEPIKSRASAAHNLALLYHTRASENIRSLDEASRDLQEALRWWNHCFECSYLPIIICDGEADFALQATVVANTADKYAGNPQAEAKADIAREVIKFSRKYIQQLLSYERYKVKASGGSEKSALIPLADEGIDEVQNIMGRSHVKDKADLHLALEKSKELSVHYKYAEAVQLLEKVKSCASSEAEGACLDEAVYEIEMARVMRGLMPIKKTPKLAESMGFGVVLGKLRDYDSATRSFNAHLRWTFLFIPIWYFGMYRIRQNKEDQWVFLGSRVSDGFSSLYNFGSVMFGIVFFIMSVFLIITKFGR